MRERVLEMSDRVFSSGVDADAACVRLANEWQQAPKRHDLRPRVLQIARMLIEAVPRARAINVDPEHIISGAIWELLEATKSEREPAEQRLVAMARANVVRELRSALDAIECQRG